MLARRQNPEGGTPSGVPTRTLSLEVDCEIPHRLERGTSSNEDVGSRREVDCEIPYRLERRTNYKGVETSP